MRGNSNSRVLETMQNKGFCKVGNGEVMKGFSEDGEGTEVSWSLPFPGTNSLILHCSRIEKFFGNRHLLLQFQGGFPQPFCSKSILLTSNDVLAFFYRQNCDFPLGSTSEYKRLSFSKNCFNIYLRTYRNQGEALVLIYDFLRHLSSCIWSESNFLH